MVVKRLEFKSESYTLHLYIACEHWRSLMENASLLGTVERGEQVAMDTLAELFTFRSGSCAICPESAAFAVARCV